MSSTQGHGFTRTQGRVASSGPRCARPHLDPGPSLTRIQGHTASPGPGIQLHPDPGARGLIWTQGHTASPGPGIQPHPDPGARGLTQEPGSSFTQTQGHMASPGPRGAWPHPDPGARGLTRTQGRVASPGSRCARPHPDPGPSLTRIQGHTASPGPGIQLHPDPGARGLTRTQGCSRTLAKAAGRQACELDLEGWVGSLMTVVGKLISQQSQISTVQRLKILLKNIYILLIFLQRGRERDRELETLMREKYQSAASCTLPTGYVPTTNARSLVAGQFSSGSSTALLAQILAPWIPEAAIKTDTRQINGASLDQDPSTSLILEALPPSPTEEPRSLSNGTEVHAGRPMAQDPATFTPPTTDLPVTEGKKQPPWTHDLKPHGFNRGRERDRELETSMREKHRSAASCTPPTGDVPTTKSHPALAPVPEPALLYPCQRQCCRSHPLPVPTLLTPAASARPQYRPLGTINRCERWLLALIAPEGFSTSPCS
ncbi:hypothetical protein QTO34_018607 [Cnephaeus nilssonii]|uniref:Uncharacterized protein n=1 Tax=Cnephaeus nilssonii TaxID=3371016 RepID=A0AA40HZ71_CNENI|nr:hypothetical protein QTO34_018607 [Eptesicus nilssonii]